MKKERWDASKKLTVRTSNAPFSQNDGGNVEDIGAGDLGLMRPIQRQPSQVRHGRMQVGCSKEDPSQGHKRKSDQNLESFICRREPFPLGNFITVFLVFSRKEQRQNNKAWMSPQKTKVQFAPCQNPLTKKMTNVFLTATVFPPREPPKGI